MGAILKKLISRSTVILKKLFGAGQDNKPVIVKPKTEKGIYKSIIGALKGNPAFPAWRRDLRLLHRRLVQYRRLRMHGSPYSGRALKRLEKQWRHVQRNSMRKIKGETGKIIPMSGHAGNRLS